MSDLQSILFTYVCEPGTEFQQELRDIGKQRIFENMLIIRLSYSCKGKVIRVFCQFLCKIACRFRQCAGEVCQGLSFPFIQAVVHKVEQCVATPTLFHRLSYIEESLCRFFTVSVHQVTVMPPRYGKKHFFQLSHSLWDRLRRFCHRLWQFSIL